MHIIDVFVLQWGSSPIEQLFYFSIHLFHFIPPTFYYPQQYHPHQAFTHFLNIIIIVIFISAQKNSVNKMKEEKQTEEIVLTTQEKLDMLDQILTHFSKPLPLPIGITRERLNGNQPDTMHIYHLHTSKVNRKTQNSNLLSKISEANKNEGSQNNPTHEKSDEEEANVESTNYRYFQGSVTCFRCKKEGHYKNMCPEPYNCLYCLSFEHNSQKCPQKNVCYKCYQLGHINQKCTFKQVCVKCPICERVHPQSSGCYFLTRGMDRAKKMFHTETLANHPDIRCAKCLNYGHIEC